MTIEKNKKTNFEKLSPSDQLAIETRIPKIKKEEFEDAYKEREAKKVLNDRPWSAGEVAMLIFFIILVSLAIIYIIILYTAQTYNMGTYICKLYNNSTYTFIDTNTIFSSKITCSNTIIKLP